MQKLVVEELSPEEEADRQQLELQSGKGVLSSGIWLRELLDRRLYRGTHKTFEEYCHDRFGFARYAAYYKIAASEVFVIYLTKVNKIHRNHQICRPGPQAGRTTSETRPRRTKPGLAAGCRDAGRRKNPSGALSRWFCVTRGNCWAPVRRILLPEFVLGDVVEIKALKRSPLYPFNGMWGMIEHVGSFSYTVHIGIAGDTQQCTAEELTD